MNKPQLSFEAFRTANVARCEKWHPKGIDSWSPDDWFTAVIGEFGELASLVKMANRERDGLPGNKFSPTAAMFGKEAADVVTYLDLLCAIYKVPLAPTHVFFEGLRDHSLSMAAKFGLSNRDIASWTPSEYIALLAQDLGQLSTALAEDNYRKIRASVWDILVHLDLFCASMNIALGQAAAAKFNEISERVGFPDRITVYDKPEESGMNSGDLMAAMMRDGAGS